MTAKKKKKNSWFVWPYQTKEELLRILGLQEEQGSSLEFLRRGYKVSFYRRFPSPLSLSEDTEHLHFSLPAILKLHNSHWLFIWCSLRPGGKKILILNYLQHGVTDKESAEDGCIEG